MNFMDSGAVRIVTADGEDIGQSLSAFTYNATINGFELRAPRVADPEASAVPALAGRSPLHVFAMGKPMCFVHFDAETRVPVDIQLDGLVIHVSDEQTRHRFSRANVVQELVVLHGVRIETPPR